MSKPVFLSTQDAELLTRTFSVANPEELPGIVETVPPDWSKAVIEADYDLRGQSRPRARCAHKGRHRHLRGFVCVLPGNVRFLVGKDCGAKKHNADMNRMKRAFNALKDRQVYLERLVRARPLLPAAMNAVRLALKSESLVAFDAARQHFRAFARGDFVLLSSAISQNNGILVKYDKVRDYAAEERRAVRESKVEDPIYKHVETPIGTLQGSAFIAPPRAAKVDLEEAQMLLREVFHALDKSTTNFSTSQLRALSEKIKSGIASAGQAIETIASLNDFFVPKNLRLVAATINAEWIVDGLKREGVHLRKPSNYSVPDFAALNELAGILGFAGIRTGFGNDN